MKDDIINKLLNDKIGLNDICKGCKQQNNMFTTPLTPYLISNKSIDPENRIMFIGKVARGEDVGFKIEDNLEDVTEFGEQSLRNSSWAFYSYTKEIVETYYGDFERALPHISFSNMVKCNNETMNDTTPYDAKICCIEKNRFIWKEVEIIEPKRLIFYTHSYYDNFINDYRPQNYHRHKDITDINFSVPIGAKVSLYWHREFYDKSGNIICKFLRVSHPMMQRRRDFIDCVLNWLREAGK